MAAPINHLPKGMFSEDEIDGLCDWYDQALASGQGFKSEEERKKYFDDLGDPLDHPLFAGSSEDLEGNEMVEAFRCLREEDKTQVELAVMYKDEGNEWLKKKVKKDLKEALIRYTHALKFLDNADKAAWEENEKVPQVQELDLQTEEEQQQQQQQQQKVEQKVGQIGNNDVLRSQILNNRALASMHLKNYGTALGDINMALLLWPENIKAHFRKCKCLLALTTKRRSELALHAAQAGLRVDPDNVDIKKLLTQCETAVATEKRKAAEAIQRQQVLDAGWTQAWRIAESRKATFGRPGEGWHHPPQLPSPLPFYANEDGERVAGGTSVVTLQGKDQWPVVVLYPQHRQLDVMQGVAPDTMLVMLLAEMFPEPEENSANSPAVHWDTEKEYYVSNLVVYVHLSSCPKFETLDEWLEYNRDAAKRGCCIEASEDDDFDSVSSKSTGNSGAISLSEVHMGCTIEQILKAKNHVLEGGLLSLMVFPKANTAPSDVYLKKFGGRKKCGLLSPLG